MGQRRGETKHKVEGIAVFVRVRSTGGLQDEGGDSSQVGGEKNPRVLRIEKD